LLKQAGLGAKEEEVKKWYNGYVFGGTTVYIRGQLPITLMISC